MRFEVAAHGPLRGAASLPGDRSLTLSVMAYAAFAPEKIAIENPSPSPDVASFRGFLEDNGAAFEDTETGFAVRGAYWSGDLILDGSVPDDIVHIAAAGAVASGRTVRLAAESVKRAAITLHLTDMIKRMGLSADAVEQDGDGVTLTGASFSPPAEIAVKSAWELETVCSAAMESGAPLTVTYPPQVVTHSVRLLALLGYGFDEPDEDAVREAELARRMAKAAGEPPPVAHKFDATGKRHPSVSMPGDSQIAASIAGAAAVIMKSDVRIKNVLWEQSRRGFFDSLRRMKADVTYEQSRTGNSFDTADVRIRWEPLESVHLNSAQSLTLTTELQILGAVAAFAGGETIISDIVDGPGVGREAFTLLSHGLEMLDVHVGDYADGFVVRGTQELRGNLVDASGLPETALAFAVAGMNASGTTAVFGYDPEMYPLKEFFRIIEELS